MGPKGEAAQSTLRAKRMCSGISPLGFSIVQSDMTFSGEQKMTDCLLVVVPLDVSTDGPPGAFSDAVVCSLVSRGGLGETKSLF
jgi:hypothetical protein